VRKEELVCEVAQTLCEADFEVSRVIPYGSYCFDIAARRELLLLLKVLVNVDSMDPQQAEQLKRLSHLISAYPLLIGDRTRTEKIENDVVHDRYDLPAINPETLRMLLENAALPLVFSTKGGYYVQIDGEMLRHERQRRGLSLGQLAEMVGVTRESIYNYEHGGNATVETAMELVEKLGVDLVRPVQILRRIEVEMRPEARIENELLRYVVQRLEELGFGVYTTQRAPFHAVAKEQRQSLLTAVIEKSRQIQSSARVISSLSKVIDITAFMVGHGQEVGDNVEGVPVIKQEEFKEITTRADLSGIIKEKQDA